MEQKNETWIARRTRNVNTQAFAVPDSDIGSSPPAEINHLCRRTTTMTSEDTVRGRRRRRPRCSRMRSLSILSLALLLSNGHAFSPTAVVGRTRPCWTYARGSPSARIRNRRRLYALPSPDFLESASHFLLAHHLPGSGFFESASHFLLSGGVSDVVNSIEIPFKEVGKDLSKYLSIANNFGKEVAAVPDRETTLVLESIGYDLLVFLAASVVVPPVARFLGVTPILGYLLAGAVLGPNALDLFANSKADLELGDIGILFLLFSEGIEVTSPRLQKLANYLPLGLAQVSLVTGVITATIMSRIPEMIDQMFLKLDPSLLGIGPTEAVVLALILCLSTSAFVFPVLKERGWEEEESGEAATSILLLQDLLVAPLLVILPYIADTAATDYEAIGFLTAKATLGFGAVLWMGSLILQKVFQLVAAAESSETFVALCLLVSAGMGIIAKFFGLTDTAGAFAAGVLLANTNYRAQIQADVLPFKGILLGIFFMDAGSNFDFQLVLEKWPTVLLGSLALLFLKSTTLGAATRVPTWMEPNRLPAADGIRVSLLLAGGGEFAFVVLALAQSLGIVPTELAGIVTAIVLITMGLTPLLGDLAAALSEPFVSLKEEEIARNKGILGLECECPMVAHNAIVVCGFGEVGQNVFRVLAEKKANDLVAPSPLGLQTASLVAFDTNPSLIDNAICTDKTIVLFGNAANAEVIRSSGVTAPSAIFITYEDSGRVHSATARLRAGFPDTPIFARASTRAKIVDLEQAGATEVVVESDELPRSSFALVQGVWSGNLKGAIIDSPEHVRAEAAAAAGISLSEADRIFEVYKSMDQDGTGRVSLTEIESVLERSSQWIASDDEIRELDQWIEGELDGVEFFDAQELCRLYGRAPEFVKRAFGVSRPATESR